MLLIPGLGVSYEIFLPLIELLKDQYYIVAVGIDGFLLGQDSEFTSVDDQAAQAIGYVQKNLNGHLDVAYGLSLGGKILSRILERNEIIIDHAIMDAAPLLPAQPGPQSQYRLQDWQVPHPRHREIRVER